MIDSKSSPRRSDPAVLRTGFDVLAEMTHPINDIHTLGRLVRRVGSCRAAEITPDELRYLGEKIGETAATMSDLHDRWLGIASEKEHVS